jgi:hypothetical protein
MDVDRTGVLLWSRPYGHGRKQLNYSGGFHGTKHRTAAFATSRHLETRHSHDGFDYEPSDGGWARNGRRTCAGLVASGGVKRR